MTRAPRYHLRTTPADLKKLAKALQRNRERRERAEAARRPPPPPPEPQREDPTP